MNDQSFETVLTHILHPPEQEPLFKEAGWDDVIVPKARRLIQNGAVTILRNSPQHIVAHVIGEGTDNDGVPDEHESEIWREDPNQPLVITLWSCDCMWGQKSWGRTRKWKKYNGRSCSHVLATLWQSMSTPQDQSEQEPGYQTPRGQKGPGGAPEMQAPSWEDQQMQMPGMEEEGPQVTGPSESEIAIPQQPGQFPKQPQQSPKFPQRQQLYLWDLTSVPGQETPAQFPPDQRTQTLQMPGAFSSLQKKLDNPEFLPILSVEIPKFRVVESDFSYYSATEFELAVQQMLNQGQTPVVQVLHPIELEAIGGKQPFPGAQPVSVNAENTPIYNIAEFGWDPATGQKVRADESTPQGPGAPEYRYQQWCPAGKRAIIRAVDPYLKEVLITVPLHLSPGLHAHALEGWVKENDLKFLPEAKDPYTHDYR